ncbi:MAG: hypothetical protein AAFX86_12355 [Pseudomonadota bacterium]
MFDFLQNGYSQLHTLNIAAHVAAGCLAIVAALFILVFRKGGKAHRALGRAFLLAFAGVGVTAVLGAVYFSTGVFLMMLTVSACYICFSGFRALRIRTSGPQRLDLTLAGLALVFCIAAGVYVELSPGNWSRVTIYTVISNLTLFSLYDLSRVWLGPGWMKRAWLNEHIFKMLSAFGALLSAGAGNILKDFAPWSQVAPSFLTYGLIVFFLLRVRPKSRPRTLQAATG